MDSRVRIKLVFFFLLFVCLRKVQYEQQNKALSDGRKERSTSLTMARRRKPNNVPIKWFRAATCLYGTRNLILLKNLISSKNKKKTKNTFFVFFLVK